MDTSKQKIALIGLGYVGLPLAVEFGNVRPVLGFDINEARIAEGGGSGGAGSDEPADGAGSQIERPTCDCQCAEGSDGMKVVTVFYAPPRDCKNCTLAMGHREVRVCAEGAYDA